MAAAPLTGYGWLAVAGGLWLGFVISMISMIFAHAPVIVQAVLGRPLPFRPVLYIPLALLHTSLVVRLVGRDAVGNRIILKWGGSVNEVALLLFVGLAATAVVRAPPAGRSRVSARPTTDGVPPIPPA